MIKITKGYALAAGLTALSSIASATPCDSALSSYSFYTSIGDSVNAAYVVSNHPECFGGSVATSETQINATSFQQISAISAAISSRLLSGATGPGQVAAVATKGLAAGGSAKPWNVWGSVSTTDTRQSYTAVNTFTTKNESDILTTVIGADYSISPTMVVGVSGAFDRGDGSGVNTAPGNAPNIITSKGYSIAPYLGMQLNKELAVDASIGLGNGKLTSGGNTESEADRWFAGVGLSYARWINNLQVTGKLAYLHAEEDYGNSKSNGTTNNGTAAKNKLDQIRLGVQGGYWMNGFMPYGGLSYVSDFNRSTTQFGASVDPIGRAAWVWTLGVNFFSLSSGVTGGVAYNQEEGRTNQKNNSLIANISLKF